MRVKFLSLQLFKMKEMNKFKFFAFVLALAVLYACAADAKKSEAAVDKEEVVTVVGTADYEIFGEAFDPKGYLSYEDFLSKMKQDGGFEGKVKGMVAEVCKVKGCWMTVGNLDDEGSMAFVKFKDYGFFMPKDIDGKTVILNGEGYTEMTSVEDLQHIAEDGGATQEEIDAITEPEEELKFLATGVILFDK